MQSILSGVRLVSMMNSENELRRPYPLQLHHKQQGRLRSGWLFVVGIAIFSGSLYLLSITGLRWLGAVTPIGGVAFIAGWVCLAVTVLRPES
ncbi:MAG: DUF423 domain-containing protein [Anaerolineae bacterium]|nr:DUF423 domain-containing protein [Anaerolineae bacterium]